MNARFTVAWLLLGACTSSSSNENDEDCELMIMAPCPECGPGEVTGGVGFALSASHARTSNGETIVLACGRATYLDASYNVLRELAIDVPRSSKIVADLSSDDLYILEVDSSYPEFPPGVAVRAVAADGSTRWRAELPTGDLTDLIAIPGGVAVIDFQDRAGAVFDRDGAELPVPGVVGVPDSTGGMIGVTTMSVADGPSSATLTAVDAAGAVRWTRTWQAPSPGFPGWLEVKPYPVESGDVVVAGGFTGTMFDLGGTTLTGMANAQTAFVARLDPTGATRWAFTLPYQAWNVSATANGDGALAIGGVYDSDGYTNGTELRLIAVTAAGLGTVQPLGSTSDLGANIDGLHAHGAGVTAVIELYAENDYEQELTIGWHRLLSGLGGRRYLVELAR